MAIFNSYVKLPEGTLTIFFYLLPPIFLGSTAPLDVVIIAAFHLRKSHGKLLLNHPLQIPWMGAA